MLSSSARSSRDEASCWGVVRDVGRPGRDAIAGVLARAAAGGHRVAQRELFRHLASRVHETLHGVLGSNDRMELHLQNAFVEIFRSLASYDIEIDLDTWACAIAVRSARRQLEGRRAVRSQESRGAIDG